VAESDIHPSLVGVLKIYTLFRSSQQMLSSLAFHSSVALPAGSGPLSAKAQLPVTCACLDSAVPVPGLALSKVLGGRGENFPCANGVLSLRKMPVRGFSCLQPSFSDQFLAAL
jgi:hypothetical protein